MPLEDIRRVSLRTQFIYTPKRADAGSDWLEESFLSQWIAVVVSYSILERS